MTKLHEGLQRYQNAAKLHQPSISLDKIAGDHVFEGGASFKSELSGLMHSVKSAGASTEKAVAEQVLGTGNVEETAMALNDLNTRLELLSQFLKVGIEKINELTSRTMGG